MWRRNGFVLAPQVDRGGPRMVEWIAGIVTIGLLLYLIVALLKPELFA
jgi:K+-transporting ATPase KdpF subunit